MSKEKVISNENLKELHSSGFEIRDGEPDIRGWKVKAAHSQEIGKVDDLLFDTDSLRVRYLIVDLDGKPLNLLSRDVLIPIGLAELDKEDNIVLLPEVTVAHLASLPDYKKGELTIETERAIRTVFAPKSGVTYTDPDYFDPKEFYNHEYFDEERMYTSGISQEYRDKVEPGNEKVRTRIVPADEKKDREIDDIEEDRIITT